MVKNKNFPLVSGIVIFIMIAVTVVFVFGESIGITKVVGREMPYADKLFSTDTVHTIDIAVDSDKWQNMLDNAISKEYISCDVTIDGETVQNVGLRPKGNSTLSSLANSESDRYSFKLEFDHYSNSLNYHGLDKMVLNNIAQDNTYMKDYLSYQLMSQFGADSPLCSFIYVTVNGEDWGLYLAVEGIEESFAERNYGGNYGQIYKPDSMSMGGNRDEDGDHGFDFGNRASRGAIGVSGGGMGFPGGDFAPPDGNATGGGMGFPGGMQGVFDDRGGANTSGGGIQGGFGGMSRGEDVALKYIDDDFESYSNIFDSAKFAINDGDKSRLIESLKQLNSGENLSEVVNIDEVLRYFVVHNFVLNFDSYTGSMMHNYYLYEKDGQLSMIAWDYNLAFGSFAMGRGGMQGGAGNTGDTSTESAIDQATTMANYPIDTPVSGTTLEDRPMLGKLLEDESILDEYHELFSEFISVYYNDGELKRMIDEAISLISPYVEKDPTAFCTYDEFTSASADLKEFCQLRLESISLQLDGTIPSTSEGQATDNSAFVDASSVNINSMGSMGFGGGGMGRQNMQQDGERPSAGGEWPPDDFSPPAEE